MKCYFVFFFFVKILLAHLGFQLIVKNLSLASDCVFFQATLLIPHLTVLWHFKGAQGTAIPTTTNHTTHANSELRAQTYFGVGSSDGRQQLVIKINKRQSFFTCISFTFLLIICTTIKLRVYQCVCKCVYECVCL